VRLDIALHWVHCTRPPNVRNVAMGVRRQTLWNHLTLFLSDTFLPVTSPV
jgi:hypothetical protein